MDKEFYGLITKEDIQIPLVGVDVYADIIGRGARVKISQKFINKEEKSLEVIYKFPLPENSAVSKFRAKVGDKIIEGEIEEKNKAFEMYGDALIEDNGAYLLEEERPNIFTLSIGNLNPDTFAILEIEYICLLETDNNEVKFFLPTTISPRYIPDDMYEVDGIPEDEKINPPIAFDVPYGMKISINIYDKENISAI
jgi:Ca-activated chloride channel family protein